MKYLLTLILSLFAITYLSAQQIIARQIPFFDQLPSNEIWDFYQDREGYIWTATTNGLARYDGNNLELFIAGHKQPDLLTNNFIISISDNSEYVWIGTIRGVNLFHKKTCCFVPIPEEVLQNKYIAGIIIDNDDCAWIAAEGVLYKCDKDGYILKAHPVPGPEPNSIGFLNSIYKDESDNLWVLLGHGGGLLKYEPFHETFINYPHMAWTNSPYRMFQDRDGNYWISTWGEGLWQFFPETADGKHYKYHPIANKRNGYNETIIFSMAQDNMYGYIWLLSYNELYALKLNEKGTFDQIDLHDLLDTNMMFTRILKDRDGNLWFSSFDMAYTIYFDESKIKNYPLLQIKDKFGWDANIVHLCADDDDILWLMQDRYANLCLYDLANDCFSYDPSGMMGSQLIVKSSIEPGIWSANQGGHIQRLIQEKGKISAVEGFPLQQFVQHPGDVVNMIEDNDGNLWIHTTNHLLIKPLVPYNVISSGVDAISVITYDTQGCIWGISSDRKIYRFSYFEETCHHTYISSLDILSPVEDIKNICIDKEGCLWIISSGGRIYVSDKEKKSFQNIQWEYKIEDSSVLNLFAEGDDVWIVTNKRVTQYDIYTGTLIDYSTSDENIQVNAFRNKAVTCDREGGILVGGHGGIVHIKADNKQLQNKENHPFVITDVKRENQSLFFSGESGGNQQIDKVYLDATDRNIEILFSSLHYSLTPRGRIAYKLEGIDKDWIYGDYTRNSAFYNQLNKGIYRFLVKSEYENGKWTEGKILITIIKKPAIYETWYAYLFYVLLAGVILYMIIHTSAKRIEAKNSIRIREELSRMKLDYFTNISHDILTPLTIISCTVDEMEEASTNVMQKGILKSNVDKLKRLIREALDFRKMDSGSMSLGVSKGNIQDFIERICQTAFIPLAETKNITLLTDISPQEMTGYLDFNKLDKILYNLLSNAIKYTPGNREIRVKVRNFRKEEHTFVSIEVEDQGIGIEPAEIDRIFSRFYSNKKNGVESNGIGLALTKELVLLHHGFISVESTPGKGSCFTVQLPIDKESYTTDERIKETTVESVEESFAETNIGENEFTILLVDDNAELLYVVRKTLEKNYHVITAINGQDAWEKLNAHPIDIAICDVMMPDENGWELCRRIKTDLRFNHIPVLILTAKNGIHDRVTSYEAGADGYIAKPFDIKVLHARIDNLINSYKKRQETFRKEENTSLESLSFQTIDKEFIQSVIKHIEQHIEEQEYDLDELATDMSISKSTLYRKIKSISGLSPLDFIRNIKMKRACMMLQHRSLNISEVAYALGYNNPKYFSKCFKQEFGITPSEYQQTTL